MQVQTIPAEAEASAQPQVMHCQVLAARLHICEVEQSSTQGRNMVQKLCLFLQKILLQGLLLDDRLGASDRRFSFKLPAPRPLVL